MNTSRELNYEEPKRYRLQTYYTEGRFKGHVRNTEYFATLHEAHARYLELCTMDPILNTYKSTQRRGTHRMFPSIYRLDELTDCYVRVPGY